MGRLDPAPVDLEYDPLFDDEEDGAAAGDIYDPFEAQNRRVFRFNQGVDRLVFDPITRGYRFVVPDPARRALFRAMVNLNAPVYMVNQVLQLRLIDAVETLGAFAMNLSFGIGGLFDTAAGVRLSLEPADFGQTMALIGVGSGPYVVFPVLGPTTMRDGIGFIVDRAFHPLTYVLAFPIQLMWGGGHGVLYREAVADGLKALEDSALDPYAVVRSAYAQARQRSIDRARDGDDEPAGQRAASL